MKRLLTSSSLGLLMLLLVAMPVVAGRAWCARDPIVTLDGVEYQLIVSVPEENVPQVNGPLMFEFYSPKGTDTDLVFMDDGFNGYGERIDFKEHDREFAHTFFIGVPRTGSDFDVLVDIYKDGTLIHSEMGTTQGMTTSVPIIDGSLDGRASTSVQLNGVGYELVVNVDPRYLGQVNGDLTVEIHSPHNTTQTYAGEQSGFNGYGQRVDLKIDNNLKSNRLFAKIQRSGNDFPVTLELYRDGALVSSTAGTSNGTWVSER